MKKQFVPYKLALKLKELGFNEECFGVCYNKDGDVRIYDGNEVGDAPLWQQVFDWFRKTYRLHGEVTIGMKGFSFSITRHYDAPHNESYTFDIMNMSNYLKESFETYEEAQLMCLEKLIELTK